jgi:branched-chain amino acid transport system permease protein
MSGFWSTILLSATISSIAALGLYLQIRSGQMNVGMAAFVGVGGYVSGILGVHAGLAPVLSVPIAVIAGFFVGAAFSALTLRLHHWFFAVTTLTLSVAAVSAIGLIRIAGGAMGLPDIPFILDGRVFIAAFLAVFAVAFLIDRSFIGISIRATGDDQVLAQVFGVPVQLLRVFVFAVGSAMAALSGALHAHRFGVYQPTDLGFHTSMLLFVYVIVGGKNSVFGPVLGAFFLYTMPELIKVDARAELIGFGLLMMIVAVWMPEGLSGAAQRLLAHARQHSA